MPKNPYKYWTRRQLYDLLLIQAMEFKISPNDLFNAVHDRSWNPMLDFNGCNCIQDEYHPFLPCFLHDYEWVVGKGSNEVDLKFKDNLIKAGFSKFRAWKYYLAVRLGWLAYYKWIK